MFIDRLPQRINKIFPEPEIIIPDNTPHDKISHGRTSVAK
jgi:hypothetical protein